MSFTFHFSLFFVPLQRFKRDNEKNERKDTQNGRGGDVAARPRSGDHGAG